ncbi:hypothetical protein SPAR_30316 [Streptomyces sparsogenes DSM 40356]|uniref:Uncharacterized protein n=1 Tax=Streptomyces sparsogenes DSM 40356 TaxID=1331668 RepID=A0A1R1SBU3_9ACTN|nr:hypothetical protein SPAR_30316 [Streptomyces sparsogenes DSM 40356]
MNCRPLDQGTCSPSAPAPPPATRRPRSGRDRRPRRYLDGLGPRVQDLARNTPAPSDSSATSPTTPTCPAAPGHIAIGCAGGEHRVIDRIAAGHAGQGGCPASPNRPPRTAPPHGSSAGFPGSRRPEQRWLQRGGHR